VDGTSALVECTDVLYRLFVVMVVYLHCGRVGRASVWYIEVPVPRPNPNPIRLDPLKLFYLLNMFDTLLVHANFLEEPMLNLNPITKII